MRLWPFGSKGSKPEPIQVLRPRITGVDAHDELITSDHPAVYGFTPREQLSPVWQAREDELVATIMAMEPCGVCGMPLNACVGHAEVRNYSAERSN